MARRCHAAAKRSAALSSAARYNAVMRKRPGWRRRAGLAWLAVVALLINALLPAALSAAPAGGFAAGMCGHAPDRAPLLPVGAAHDCALCCVAAAPPRLPPAEFAGLDVAGAAEIVVPAAAPPAFSPCRAPQPRGPPDRA
jgi:hypothetical protein